MVTTLPTLEGREGGESPLLGSQDEDFRARGGEVAFCRSREPGDGRGRGLRGFGRGRGVGRSRGKRGFGDGRSRGKRGLGSGRSRGPFIRVSIHVKQEENSAPRLPTHPGAQLGDGPHSPEGWWAARNTAGLYGARSAKSSRTRSPGAGPRGQQPPRHQAATRQDHASRKQGARTAQVPALRDSDGPCTRRQPPAYPSPGPLDAIKPGRHQGQRRSHTAADKRVQAPAPRQRGQHSRHPRQQSDELLNAAPH